MAGVFTRAKKIKAMPDVADKEKTEKEKQPGVLPGPEDHTESKEKNRITPTRFGYVVNAFDVQKKHAVNKGIYHLFYLGHQRQ